MVMAGVRLLVQLLELVAEVIVSAQLFTSRASAFSELYHGGIKRTGVFPRALQSPLKARPCAAGGDSLRLSRPPNAECRARSRVLV